MQTSGELMAPPAALDQGLRFSQDPNPEMPSGRGEKKRGASFFSWLRHIAQDPTPPFFSWLSLKGNSTNKGNKGTPGQQRTYAKTRPSPTHQSKAPDGAAGFAGHLADQRFFGSVGRKPPSSVASGNPPGDHANKAHCSLRLVHERAKKRAPHIEANSSMKTSRTETEEPKKQTWASSPKTSCARKT